MIDMDDMTARKDRLIEACFMHVPFDGWTETTLDMASQDSEGNKDAWRQLFDNKVSRAFAHYNQRADRMMAEAFYDWLDASDMPPPVHVKIRQLILIRLEAARPHKEVVRKSLSYLSRPEHAKLAATSLYATIDEMWRCAGDTSTDFNFYTKRASLSAVYSATLLAFLADDTDDMSKTEAFLDRRLADIAKIPSMKRPFMAATQTFQQRVQERASRFAQKMANRR
jgi:ubiquinone biosynthesis protein COQ9